MTGLVVQLCDSVTKFQMSTTQHGYLESLFQANSRKLGPFKEIWSIVLRESTAFRYAFWEIMSRIKICTSVWGHTV